jgi:hypothetical protein
MFPVQIENEDTNAAAEHGEENKRVYRYAIN